MVTKIKDTTYTVSFFHKNKDKKIDGYEDITILKSYTSCNIKGSIVDQGIEKTGQLSSAIVYLNPKDNFNYALGRKYAFAKAIKNFDRETRTELWKAYLLWNPKTKTQK